MALVPQLSSRHKGHEGRRTQPSTSDVGARPVFPLGGRRPHAVSVAYDVLAQASPDWPRTRRRPLTPLPTRLTEVPTQSLPAGAATRGTFSFRFGAWWLLLAAFSLRRGANVARRPGGSRTRCAERPPVNGSRALLSRSMMLTTTTSASDAGSEAHAEPLHGCFAFATSIAGMRPVGVAGTASERQFSRHPERDRYACSSASVTS